MGITIYKEDDRREEMIVLKVKTLSEKPLRVEVALSATVAELKELVKEKAHAEDKFLRLIHQGKMLSDDGVTLASCKVKNEDFVHCAMSSTPSKAAVQQVCELLLLSFDVWARY